MLKRLALGLVKGLLIGGLIGAGIQYGLRWTMPSGGLLAYLLAMGASGTTGVFAGKPPWYEGAWIEAMLKGMVGVGLGALGYWAASSWAAVDVPLPGLEAPAPWTALPILFLPAISAIYGALVELDNTDESHERGKKGAARGPNARVAVNGNEEADLDEAPARKTVSTRGRKG